MKTARQTCCPHVAPDSITPRKPAQAGFFVPAYLFTRLCTVNNTSMKTHFFNILIYDGNSR